MTFIRQPFPIRFVRQAQPFYAWRSLSLRLIVPNYGTPGETLRFARRRILKVRPSVSRLDYFIRRQWNVCRVFMGPCMIAVTDWQGVLKGAELFSRVFS